MTTLSKQRATAVRTTAVLIALLAVLTGCLRFDADVSVDDDGSGRVEILQAIDTSVLDMLGGMADGAGDLGDPCTEIGEDVRNDPDLPADLEVEDYEDGDFCGARVTYELPAGTDHSDVMSRLLDSDTTLRKEGDNWVFAAGTESLTEITEDDDLEGAPFDVNELFGDAEISWSVELPGRPIDTKHNADKVDGNRFTWDIDLLNPPASLFAQTEPGEPDGGGFPWLPLLLGLLGLALLGALAWFFLRSRGAGAETSAPAASAGFDATTPQTVAPVAQTPVQAAPMAAAPDPVAPVAQTPVQAAPMAAAPDPVAPVAQTPVQADPAAATPVADTPTEDRVASASAATPGDSATASSAPTPTWDAARNAWVVQHPTRGWLVHDASTDEWRPI